jgi:hypothetical protein
MPSSGVSTSLNYVTQKSKIFVEYIVDHAHGEMERVKNKLLEVQDVLP